MFFTFYKIKEGNQKIQNTSAILLENAPFLRLYVSLWVAQSHTPLNTAVFMAFYSSGEGKIKKESEM